MCAEYIQEIGLESEPLLLHFPTLRIRQLTLFGSKSRGFVIYNQFSALVSSCTRLSFLQFVSCPKGPRSIPPLYRSSHSPLLLPLSLSLSIALSPCTAEAHQVCPSCASNGSCLPWYIITEPREHRPTRFRRALTTFAQVFRT